MTIYMYMYKSNMHCMHFLCCFTFMLINTTVTVIIQDFLLWNEKVLCTCTKWLHMNQRRSREFVLVNATFRYIWCWNVCTVFFFKLTSCSFFQLFTNILVVNFYLELSPVTCSYNYFFISSINVHMYYLQSGFKYCTRIHSLSILHLYFPPFILVFIKPLTLWLLVTRCGWYSIYSRFIVF